MFCLTNFNETNASGIIKNVDTKSGPQLLILFSLIHKIYIKFSMLKLIYIQGHVTCFAEYAYEISLGEARVGCICK